MFHTEGAACAKALRWGDELVEFQGTERKPEWLEQSE